MAWMTEFQTTDRRGRRVEYQTRHLNGYSSAERPDRVRVSGKTVHTGYACDHQGFNVYLSHIRITEERATS